MRASEGRVAVAAAAAVDWLRRVERQLRLVRRGVLRAEREQERHTLGVGVVVTLRNELLRPVKDRRLSRGGIVCREMCVVEV